MKNSLINKWKLYRLPESNLIPAYLYSEPIGPDFALKILKILYSSDLVLEKFDFDDEEFSFVENISEVDGSGDILYILYNDPQSWVYIFVSDLSWASLLTNENPQDLLPTQDLVGARRNYVKSYFERKGLGDSYYDVDKLRKWSSVLGSELR